MNLKSGLPSYSQRINNDSDSLWVTEEVKSSIVNRIWMSAWNKIFYWFDNHIRVTWNWGALDHNGKWLQQIIYRGSHHFIGDNLT